MNRQRVDGQSVDGNVPRERGDEPMITCFFDNG